ncbi:hypothetical protein EOB59_10455 [Mesorhizobium sp. M7A.F.Ca.MR.176.00.0.0]|uniref:hypothetical protein n=1 Tax=unclassified Mesorhizobium TaxID=325217 RepID=UPI000FD5F5BB|nr:hypothetical protein [Mesorhizobium sp. M7A.F.Ca.MR.176.00.0.0]RUU91755.1 hypothetical protein EOB59_10455 [Mesorhizobium sp. M7A.F.Ca.MR.176.00.0.0]
MTKHQVERLVAATFEGWGQCFGDRAIGRAFSASFSGRKELCQISVPSVPQLVTVEVVLAKPAHMFRPGDEEQHGKMEPGGIRRLWIESIDTYALGRFLDVLERSIQSRTAWRCGWPLVI